MRSAVLRLSKRCSLRLDLAGEPGDQRRVGVDQVDLAPLPVAEHRRPLLLEGGAHLRAGDLGEEVVDVGALGLQDLGRRERDRVARGIEQGAVPGVGDRPRQVRRRIARRLRRRAAQAPICSAPSSAAKYTAVRIFMLLKSAAEFY